MYSRNKYLKATTALLMTLGLAASAHAVPVTVNMTADNLIADGGLCADANCTDGIGWGALGSTTNFGDWTQSDSLVLDLGSGTHYFAWLVVNIGSPSSGNPAALLAEILWAGHANYSSSAWEIYNCCSSGAFIANATEYGLNGGPNIWTSVNGGPVGGISGNANWIYTANNFANADASAWIRTSIRVPEPATLSLLGVGLLGIGFMRRRRRAA